MKDARSSTKASPNTNRAGDGDGLLGRPRPRDLAPAVRPFTTMGSALLHLDATAAATSSPESPLNRSHQPPATAGAVPNRQLGATEGDFDVRRFLLDQKGTQPFHRSAVFRTSNFAQLQTPDEMPQAEGFQRDGISRSKKLVLPRMDLSASKSTSALPGPIKMNEGTQKLRRLVGDRNQQSDEDDATSHYYTLEKMAESCFHATQNKNKTWLFLPGSNERSKGSNGASSIHGNSITGIERPSRRVDVLDLDRCFDTAIQFIAKKNHSDVACEERLSMIDRDFTAIHARIAQRYQDGERAEGEHKVLTKLLFEQKWSDVILGELEAMLTVSFLEQGVILRKARIHYAQAFFHLEHIYGQRWQELIQVKEDLEQLREVVRKTNELHEQDAQGMKEHYECEIQQLTTSFDSVKSEMERRVTDSKDQMTKMGDTMKALNTVFRQMREDTEKVKAVELRENYIKLEQKYEQCREEVEQLRPLVQEKQQLLAKIAELNRAHEAYKDQAANLNHLLDAKDAMIASLMEQQSDLIAAQELRAAKEEEQRKQDEEDDEEEEEERREQATRKGDTDAIANRQRRHQSSSVMVCVRCKQDLRDMSTNPGQLEGSKGSSAEGAEKSSSSSVEAGSERSKRPIKKKRIQCLYFRILLPSLGGRRPQRDIAWTFSCMRSIVLAKQIDDSMCKRSGGVFPMRIRMPEFVYAWFAPWRSIKEAKDIALDGPPSGIASGDAIGDADNPDAVASAEQLQLHADEDRWCLYYGVRSLVQQGYLEAKLFLSLLDEKFGEDEQVFMLYCYRVLDILIGGRLDWGPLRDKTSYESFAHEYDHLFARSSNKPEDLATQPSHSPILTPRVPKTVWISPYHASLATSVILSKATEAERAALDKKILEYVVTNVPEEEKPTLYLFPMESTESTHAEAEAETVGSKHKKERSGRHGQRGGTDDDNAAEGDAQAPQQFVDANLWVELMMLEYKEEQAHRRAAVRLMFQTATSSSVTWASESAANLSLSAMLGINSTCMDMEQFRVMVQTLNDEIPSFMVATLYRNAYVRGNGMVNFDSFMDAAEAGQFFSTCMRLESAGAVVARLSGSPRSPTFAASSTSARAAYIVDKFMTILRHELRTTIAAQPIWTRSMTDSLTYEITSSLMEGTTYCDGVRLLTSFHRLIDSLGMVKLVRREVMGGVFSSKNLFSIEKALQSLLEFVRQKDKSAVEIMVDALKQKLCVKRVQATFRKYLQRDHGAPLVMRPLMHRRYGRAHLDYRHRKAERPVIWLRLVISLLLRQSLVSVRMHNVLGELSSLSSAFHTSRPSLNTMVPNSSNGGIGPTPKPIFVELIYDYFLEKFGTRSEAERIIHDVFSNCRSLVRSDSLALLFSHLCCMSNSSPEDRLLGQNEALCFLHAIFRCGLHNFRLINPHVSGQESSKTSRANASVAMIHENSESVSSHDEPSSVLGQLDFVPIDVVETILLSAFSKLSADQKMRLRLRIIESADDRKNSTPPTRMEANAFLVLALHEWRRFILHRLNEIRVNCCALEEELAQFEELLQLETLGAILQKTGIAYTSEDLCVVFRRLCITENVPVDTNASGGGIAFPTTSTPDPMSDRIAAACFPLVVKEALSELLALEHAADEPFKINPSPLQSYEFLVSTWNDYQGPCRVLLDQLQQIGKDNDVQAKALSRWQPTSPAGGKAEVLYLSSSSSSETVSSQDVAQQEAVHALFLERLQRLTLLFDSSSSGAKTAPSVPANRRRSISVNGDGSLLLVDEVNTQDMLVKETWKVFRQMFVGFVKLRAIARIGKGALPDEWDSATV